MTDRLIPVGRIAGVYGVRGWVKVISETDPIENILGYSPWLLSGAPGAVRECDSGQARDLQADVAEWRVERGQRHGKGLIACLHGCADRDQARLLIGASIAVRRSQLPPPDADEFYWADLEGLAVETDAGIALGRVSHLLATGANDVLVVRDETRERLIPFVWEQVIKELDFERGRMRVDWDPAF
jgi:16S rRNA processing protein RimM